jgi:hypothetical protein
MARDHVRAPDGPMSADGDAALDGYLPVGSPARRAIRRAVLGALLAGLAFSCLTGPLKQLKPLYAHAPWLNDPFDLVVSFAMVFAPLATAYCLVRLPLCRRYQPLPLGRVRGLLRGCQVVLAVTAVTLLSEWVSVAMGANRPQWNAATWLQVALLVLLTAMTGGAAAGLLRVRAWLRPVRTAAGPGPDWLADLVVIAARLSRGLGPLRRPALSALARTDRHLLSAVRRHPVWSAAAAAAAFGLVVGGNQAIRESYLASAAGLAIFLLGCGMFAFLVAAGSYLELVHSRAPMNRVRRRALDASVLACFGMLTALAFRNSLWWMVGSHAATAGIAQAYALLGLAALAVFAAVFVVESMLGSHAATSR